VRRENHQDLHGGTSCEGEGKGEGLSRSHATVRRQATDDSAGYATAPR
jgi:hypothetical protein